MRKVLAESRGILEKHGINWYSGRENLVWAPNVKGQHTIDVAKQVLSRLKRADKTTGTRKGVEWALSQLGDRFARVGF